MSRTQAPITRDDRKDYNYLQKHFTSSIIGNYSKFSVKN